MNLITDHKHLNRIFREWNNFQQMINIFVVPNDYHHHHHFGLYFVSNKFYLQLLILQLISVRLLSFIHTAKIMDFVGKNAE